MSLEIICSHCGEDTIVRREPIYEGFKKTGDRIFCSSCGHEFPDANNVPYKKKSGPNIFTDADRPKKPDIFNEDEKGKNCRHCEHYVVNPFVQRCSLHMKEVQATDICFDFKKKPPDEIVEKPAKPEGKDA